MQREQEYTLIEHQIKPASYLINHLSKELTES